MKIKQGVEGGLGSVISGLRTNVWYHDVRLLIGPDGIDTKVGFSWDLDSNLLGQIGFFDNYTVTFNPIPNPPSFSFVRIEPN